MGRGFGLGVGWALVTYGVHLLSPALALMLLGALILVSVDRCFPEK